MSASNRYIRQMSLPGFGAAAQEKLRAAKVLVVGAGGLGVAALQHLCACGVGNLGLVDDDVVSLHNLHRQVLYETADVGRKKVHAAIEKLSRQNPEVQLQGYVLRLSPDNVLPLVGDYDLVLDATDNFGTRYLINDACVMLGRPFVYGAAQGYEGQYAVFNAGDGPTYRCLFPERPPAGLIPDCDGGGVLGLAPAIIGSFQALEAVKLITGIGTLASGTLQLHDFRFNSVRAIRLRTVAANKTRSALETDYGPGPAAALPADTLYNMLTAGDAPAIVDIREAWELDGGSLQGALCVELSDLAGAVAHLSEHSRLLVICEQGLRSAAAAVWLQERLPKTAVMHLEGGMARWQALFNDQFLRS